MLHGQARLEECYYALADLSDDIKQRWSTVERWVVERLFHEWCDTGFEYWYATYREVNWLYATRWMISAQDRIGDWAWLDSLEVQAPFQFDRFDLAQLLAPHLPDLPRGTPVTSRLRYLFGVLNILQPDDSKEARRGLLRMIPDSSRLDPIEAEAKSVFGRIQHMRMRDSFDHAQVVGTLAEKVLARLIQLTAESAPVK